MDFLLFERSLLCSQILQLFNKKTVKNQLITTKSGVMMLKKSALIPEINTFYFCIYIYIYIYIYIQYLHLYVYMYICIYILAETITVLFIILITNIFFILINNSFSCILFLLFLFI